MSIEIAYAAAYKSLSEYTLLHGGHPSPRAQAHTQTCIWSNEHIVVSMTLLLIFKQNNIHHNHTKGRAKRKHISHRVLSNTSIDGKKDVRFCCYSTEAVSSVFHCEPMNDLGHFLYRFLMFCGRYVIELAFR